MELGELDQPRPLRGRLGLRELLFTRRSAPLTAYFPVSRAEKILIGLTSLFMLLLGAYCFSRMSDEISRGELEEMLGILSIINLALSEFLIILFGFLFTTRQLGLWQRQHRISEFVLTTLRPIEFGQCVIAAPVKSFVLFLGLSYTGFAMLLFYFFLEHSGMIFWFLLIYALGAINAVINLYAFSWIALPHCLIYGWFRSSICYITVIVMYVLALIPPAILLFWLLGFMMPHVNNTGHGTIFMSCIFPVAFVVTWIVKLLFARAYAARLEQVVFPRLTF